MKVLTLNFLTCAVKACKSTSSSFPLHPKDCELVSDTIELNEKLIFNVLPRIDWAALSITASEVLPTLYLLSPSNSVLYPSTSFFPFARAKQIIEKMYKETKSANEYPNAKLGFPPLPASPPTPEELSQDEKMLKELHTLLLETQISEGALVCGNCGHEYKIHEGITNFLLPNHLV